MAFSPLTKRRLGIFRRHRRGFFSLWIVIFLFIITMGAELWCNDKPLIVVIDGGFKSPLLIDYTEKDFGGELGVAVNYRDPYFETLLTQKGGWAIWPLVTYNFQSVQYDRLSPAPPSFKNWLGTDDQGRDVLARLIYGFRSSILFGLYLTAFSGLLGILIGGVQGYFGGRVDFYGQRFIEIWSGLPVLFLLIILGGMIRPNFWWLLGIILPFSWMGLSSLVRAEFLRVRRYDYIRAAQAFGVPSFRIITRHALPNATVAALTYAPFLLNHSITTLTSLDFLGFGLPAGSASLGELLQQGKNNLHASWLGLTAFMSIATFLTLLTFIGEAIRDAFDPKKT